MFLLAFENKFDDNRLKELNENANESSTITKIIAFYNQTIKLIILLTKSIFQRQSYFINILWCLKLNKNCLKYSNSI